MSKNTIYTARFSSLAKAKYELAWVRTFSSEEYVLFMDTRGRQPRYDFCFKTEWDNWDKTGCSQVSQNKITITKRVPCTT